MDIIDMRCRPAFLHDFFGRTPGTPEYEVVKWLNGRVGTRGDLEHFTRSATADVYESLTPSRKLTLEESLEFAANDECVEVTPESVRVRKVTLDSQERFKIAARERRMQR